MIEDHEEVHRFLCEMIRLAGHNVDGVKSKAEALVMLSQGSHDILVADMGLPDGTGGDLAAIAAQLGIGTILITGHPERANALDQAGVPYLMKPFRMDELEEMLRRRLGEAT